MGIDLKALGAKLAKYRGQLTESVGEVASATGIDAERLAAIEAGQSEPTGDEVLILADHYRSMPTIMPTIMPSMPATTSSSAALLRQRWRKPSA